MRTTKGGNMDTDVTGCGYSESLDFNSEFEGGNAGKVSRVFDRGNLPDFTVTPSKSSGSGTKDPHNCPMVTIDQEYDISLRKDIYTAGNMQWFHFGVSTSEMVKQSSEMGVRLDNYRDDHVIRKYPCTVRFNINNFLKKDSLFNYGMKVSTYSHRKACEAAKIHNMKQTVSPIIRASNQNQNQSGSAFPFSFNESCVTANHETWTHGGEHICYYRNGHFITRKKRTGGSVVLKKRPLYTLSFTYTFTGPDCVHFAYCCPYTYSDLQMYLQKLENDERIKVIMRRQKLCNTLMGNRCDLLTICEPVLIPDKPQASRPAIVVTGRIHPGEANASHAIQGFIDFITDPDNAQAYLLRKMFVFKIIPMLNPGKCISY